MKPISTITLTFTAPLVAAVALLVPVAGEQAKPPTGTHTTQAAEDQVMWSTGQAKPRQVMW